MSIDTTTDPQLTESIEIHAPIEKVWGLVSGIDKWPAWNPAIKQATLNGPLAAGSTFVWQSGPGAITSQLEIVEAPAVIAWSGKSMGISVFHAYYLASTNGVTVVTTKEWYKGLLATLLGGYVQKTMVKTVREALVHLKTAAEAEKAAI